MNVEGLGPAAGSEEPRAERGLAGCRAPCDVVVPPGSYRVGAPGRMVSDDIDLAGDRPLTIKAKLGSKGQRYAGYAMTGVGLTALLLAGLVVAAIPDLPDSQKTIGYASIGLGAVVVGIGIGLWVGSISKVMVEEQPATASRVRFDIRRGALTF